MNKIKSFTAGTALIMAVSMLTGCGTRSAVTEIIDTPIITVTITETAATENIQTKAAAETTAEPDTESESLTSAENEGYPVVDDSYVAYHFRSKRQLNEHYEKHGAEFNGDFDYKSAEEYEEGASDVINNDDALFKYEKEDGDEVYYIEDTNEFVILSNDGFIRTYFRPNSGKKYFDRQ
ncbi:MAG: hypothetical protein IIZ53_07130 [Ruminococcus sp.]|nr:hypothetical protein [Ruminococcus sp.]